ncbi:FAD binding domain-containing protein [Syncephalastrum racemosum]|uniref:Fumarate reductase n=1 Tax=Syncephalastrum racemosum TaxID=13706 RepID=A0A1X2H2G3_SYNRA|nr:FAD binding domain-containing protein [Syncephalastrum racemosum]
MHFWLFLFVFLVRLPILMQNKCVVVIGGGLAGLSAAIEAATTSTATRVLLLEKEKQVGGNSAKATSGINGVQRDQMEAFEQDTLQSGGGRSDMKLVHKLVEESNDALAWLKAQDATLDLSSVSQCGGHSQPRTHRCPAKNGKPVPVGWRLIHALKQRAQGLSNIEIQTETPVQHLAPHEGSGWRINRAIDASALILATGGFGGDPHSELFRRYAPSGVATTNGPWADGAGVQLGVTLGAAARDLDQVQIHPTGFVDPADPDASTKFLAPEALRAVGAILLNAHGRRFANELARRDVLARAIQEQQGAVYLVMTDAMAEEFGKPTLGFYAAKHLFQQTDSLDHLSQQLHVTSDALLEEFSRYDSQHEKDDFGKTVFSPHPFIRGDGPSIYWVAQIIPCVHYTMGGLAMDTSAHVLNHDLQPIPGLFAAGEVTGGLHGRNRLAGNSLLECVVYGRTAGRNAVLYANDHISS